MILQIIRESLIVFIALFFGLRAYKYMRRFHTIVFMQLIAWILIYILSYGVTVFQKQKGIPMNNQWLFNINMMVETILLSTAAYIFFNEKFKKMLTIILLIFFLFFAIIEFIRDGFYLFNVQVYIVQSLVVALLFSKILFDCFYNNRFFKLKLPELLISAGILLFFACNLPYLSLFNYLNENYARESLFLFQIITEVLSNMRYLLLTVGFWLITNKKIKPQLLKT